jgi:hypothetical protein
MRERAHRAQYISTKKKKKLTTHRSGPCSKCGGELAAHGGPPPQSRTSPAHRRWWREVVLAQLAAAALWVWSAASSHSIYLADGDGDESNSTTPHHTPGKSLGAQPVVFGNSPNHTMKIYFIMHVLIIKFGVIDIDDALF